MSSPTVRDEIISTFRRDLVGPGPQDADLAAERLREAPSRWYLTGFLAPEDLQRPGGADEDDPALQEEVEPTLDLPDPIVDGTAPDEATPEAPAARRRFLPSSIGITVLLDPAVSELTAEVSWGDYLAEPPLTPAQMSPDANGDDPATRPRRPEVEWVRTEQRRSVTLAITDGDDGRRNAVFVPESNAPQRPGGALQLETHSRGFRIPLPDGTFQDVRAVTVFLVNRRPSTHRRYADLAFVFQARIELRCEGGFVARRDPSGMRASDDDLRIADLHYRDVEEYAVGRNVAADWDRHQEAAGCVTRVWTDPLPVAAVPRVKANDRMDPAIRFGMEDLALAAAAGGTALHEALVQLPVEYSAWIARELPKRESLEPKRRKVAGQLVQAMQRANERIAEGIELLRTDETARLAFRIMNSAIALAARRRVAVEKRVTPDSLGQPTWRPFQLAFILLNLSGLTDKRHPDRELVDLLFFPTGGGKTEAYLGLAAFVITWRRLTGPGVLGAGVAVIMRYTLRLLTLDQLSRAAGVVCALELMRTGTDFLRSDGRRQLGDHPIEIGLWVGSDASPNKLGSKGDKDERTAYRRVLQYRKNPAKVAAPAPIKACPWCGTEFSENSFACVPSNQPLNLELRCTNQDCDFTADRPLPIVTVDEAIYRRLPSFLVATVDKFASLPWVGEAGAFFGHVDRYDPVTCRFSGASDPGSGLPLDNGFTLDPPDLIVQDELHLISGPLGTVAGLYETAIDRLASRGSGEFRIRPKIVASTATVRRAKTQIEALFDRHETHIFPPPGIDRTDSFFAVTSTTDPPRLYMGIGAQGRGPKVMFLRSLTTLVAAAQAARERWGTSVGPGEINPADPYMTALCYFNALRELGGARRIVEDEVLAATKRYGDERRRVTPVDEKPFANRRCGQPIELTSRESTDSVAKAKKRLDTVFGAPEAVDVALATNMISVGLDITRLGLMLVQGQPKTAAEYIQATSRVGRDHNRPGLVLTILNLHKPRDRAHFEQFGQFHRTFYRAVEATSVTPWAARATDRALAAVLVSIARHVRPDLTREDAAVALCDIPGIREEVVNTILARAPADKVPGGHVALKAAIDGIIDDWLRTADEKTSSGTGLTYAAGNSARRLLQYPLDPTAIQLPRHRRSFEAARSMRDVEPNVLLKVKTPHGETLAES
jgi:hypothetical protein